MSNFIDGYKHRGMRRVLVQQIYRKGIRDERVLRAMEQIPRHAFMDSAFVEHAYQDKAFQIGEGQTISQPYTVAFQSELLQVIPGQRILEIGTGSGYQCAVLVAMGAQVYSIEYNQVLYGRAKKKLRELGYQAHLFHGDGSKGLASHAPYDRILVTAGAPMVPEALTLQLRPHGRLVIPVGNRDRQEMLLISKDSEGNVHQQSYDFFSFVPLLGSHGWT
uniref:Protein-L-isoaspartate O-methyltransferase n=1 Tax=Roseihalotalea indica TaxID=2867963 RepID=A0AA49GQ86_9BACT|nr:protein-L-isoaspartate(D-aspartate) O-methyltransferase [Tunicatimonas sp. TK19036]